MKAKRSPVKGPLLTFALMLGSVAVVVVISRYFDSHQKTAQPEQTVAASANGASASGSRQ
jgi:Tfp pilus assembly protein PilW